LASLVQVVLSTEDSTAASTVAAPGSTAMAEEENKGVAALEIKIEAEQMQDHNNDLLQRIINLADEIIKEADDAVGELSLAGPQVNIDAVQVSDYCEEQANFIKESAYKLWKDGKNMSITIEDTAEIILDYEASVELAAEMDATQTTSTGGTQATTAAAERRQRRNDEEEEEAVEETEEGAEEETAEAEEETAETEEESKEETEEETEEQTEMELAEEMVEDMAENMEAGTAEETEKTEGSTAAPERRRRSATVAATTAGATTAAATTAGAVDSSTEIANTTGDAENATTPAALLFTTEPGVDVVEMAHKIIDTADHQQAEFDRELEKIMEWANNIMIVYQFQADNIAENEEEATLETQEDVRDTEGEILEFCEKIIDTATTVQNDNTAAIGNILMFAEKITPDY